MYIFNCLLGLSGNACVFLLLLRMVSGLKAFSLAGIQQTRGRRVKESAFYFVPAALIDKIEYPAQGFSD